MSAAFISDRAWPAHHRIDGYELVAALRESDSGILYRAWDLALSRPVLLEEFLPVALAQRGEDGLMRPALPAAAPLLDRARRRFAEEARLLARTDHPALVRVLHLVEAHGTMFRVMPGYTGATLAELMARDEAPRDEPMLRRLLEDTLGALDAWHATAGPHGGVRPTQILCQDNGHALLMGPDAVGLMPLGSGGWPDTLQPLATGSQGADERDDEQGIADDLQALARVVRACMLDGAPVQPGLSLQAALARGAGGSGPQGEAYSPALVQALDAALSDDPQRRPKSAAQMAQWLRGAALPETPRAAGSPEWISTATAHGAGAAPALQRAPAERAGPAYAPAETFVPDTDFIETDETEVDPTTAAFIRSIVDAIPDVPAGRNRPARKAPVQPPASASVGPTDPPLHSAPPGAAPGPRLHAARPDPLQRGAPPARQHQLKPGGAPAALTAVLVVAASLAWWWQSGAEPDQPVQDTGGAAVFVAPSADAAPGGVSGSAQRAPEGGPMPSAAPPAPAAPSHTAPAAAPSQPTVNETVPPPPPAPREAAPAPAARQRPPIAAVNASPRQQCGERTEFSLYRCMQQQCAQPRWRSHPQCIVLREFDRVPG